MHKHSIYLLTSIFIVALVLLSGISYSLLEPNDLPLIDEARLPVQSTIMTTVSDIIIDESYELTEQERNGVTDITFLELQEYTKQLAPGDIVFMSNRGYVGGYFIEGKWKHTFLYLGTKENIEEAFKKNSTLYYFLLPYYKTGNEELILDASLHGVHIRPLEELSELHKNSLLQASIGLHMDFSPKEKEAFIKATISHLEKPYDFDLLTENTNTIYCSELFYHTVPLALEAPSKILNKHIITPNDLLAQLLEQKETALIYYIEKNTTIQERSLTEAKATVNSK